MYLNGIYGKSNASAIEVKDLGVPIHINNYRATRTAAPGAYLSQLFQRGEDAGSIQSAARTALNNSKFSTGMGLGFKDITGMKNVALGRLIQKAASDVWWIADVGAQNEPDSPVPKDIKSMIHMQHPSLRYAKLLGAGTVAGAGILASKLMGKPVSAATLGVSGILGAGAGALAQNAAEMHYAKPYTDILDSRLNSKYGSYEVPVEFISDTHIGIPASVRPQELEMMTRRQHNWVDYLPTAVGALGAAAGAKYKGAPGAFMGLAGGGVLGTLGKEIALQHYMDPYKAKYVKEIQDKYKEGSVSGIFSAAKGVADFLQQGSFFKGLGHAAMNKISLNEAYKKVSDGTRELNVQWPTFPLIGGRITNWHNPSIKDTRLHLGLGSDMSIKVPVGKWLHGAGKAIVKHTPDKVKNVVNEFDKATGVVSDIKNVAQTHLPNMIKKVPERIERFKDYADKNMSETHKNIFNTANKAVNIYGHAQIPLMLGSAVIGMSGLDKKVKLTPKNQQQPQQQDYSKMANTLEKDAFVGSAISLGSKLIKPVIDTFNKLPKPVQTGTKFVGNMGAQTVAFSGMSSMMAPKPPRIPPPRASSAPPAIKNVNSTIQ